MKQRLLSMLLVVVMMVTMLPFCTIASSAVTSGDFEYVVLDDGTAEITNYTGDSYAIIYPTIDGYKVSAIGENAFSNKKLSKVEIHYGIETIKNNAFSGNGGLTEIHIPNSVAEFGTDVFLNSANATVHCHQNSYIYKTYDSWKHATEHLYTEDFQTIMPPSCTAQGEMAKYCIYCGIEKESKTIASLGHMYSNDWSVMYDSTCAQTGRKIKVCDRCDYKLYQNIEKKQHTVSEEWIIDNEATCSAEGLMHKDCTVCGAKIQQEVIEKYQHFSSDWIIDTNSTCTNEGSKHKECTVCGEILQTEIVDALAPNTGHTFGLWNVEIEPTCTQKGEEARVCDVCGAKETKAISALGHISSSEWVVVKLPTCTESGTKTKECTICKTVISTATIEKNSHNFGETETVAESSCISTGRGKHSCIDCGTTEYVSLPLKEHEYNISENNSLICNNCGLEKTFDYVITTDEALQLTYKAYKKFEFVVSDTSVAYVAGISTVTTSLGSSYQQETTATINSIKPGYTTISIVDMSGNVIISKSLLVVEGEHQFVYVETCKYATCTETGCELHKCKFCNEEKYVEIPISEHLSTEWIIDVNATCTTNGSKYTECTLCGEKLETESIEKIEHSSSEWIIDTNPTCTTDGLKHKECTSCGVVIETEGIAATGHDLMGEWVTTIEPTCEDDGLTQTSCLNCGEMAYETIVAFGHNYVNGSCVNCGGKDPSALNGWVAENGKWAYYENGTKVTNRWVKDSIGWCFLGDDGYCVTNSWKKDSIGWCYLDSNGRMVCNNWVYDGGKWYFIDANGYMVSNCWKKDSKGWCYLGSSGAMLTNAWVKDSVGWCYIGADGYCVTNKWVKDSKGWCYLDSQGRMVYNKWVKDSIGWCYVGSNGYMVTSQWVKYNSQWYYLNANGYMATGTKTINGKTYKFNSSGVWIG